MKKLKTNTDKSILTIVVGLTLISILSEVNEFLYAAVIIGGVSLVSVSLSKWIEKLWMCLANVLSYIIPNIILTLLFYLVLTPLAYLSRLGNKNPLQLKNTEGSMFKDRITEFQPTDFDKMW